MSIKVLNENLKNKRFSTLYYLYGAEEYLKNYYYDEIKKNSVSDMQEFNVVDMDGKKFSFVDFCNNVNSYPVMANHKFIGVTDLDNSAFKKDFTKEFTAFLKTIPEYCTVVFLDTYLKPEPTTNYLLKSVENAGGIAVQMIHPDMKSLISWALKHFKSEGKDISVQDVSYLIEMTNSDMLSLGNEIAKLCSYTVGKTVTKEDVDNLATRSVDANRYEITDALCARKYDKILSIVDKLYKQGTDDILIASVFYKTFLDMWKIRAGYEKKVSCSQLAKDLKMNPYIVNKILRNSLSFDKSFLHFAIIESLELDRQIKSTPFNNRDLITAYIAKIVDRRRKID